MDDRYVYMRVSLLYRDTIAHLKMLTIIYYPLEVMKVVYLGLEILEYNNAINICNMIDII